MKKMERDLTKVVEKVLIDNETILNRIQELADQITADYIDKEEDLILVGILKGAAFFTTELALRLGIPCYIDFMSVTSYGKATESSGVVRILKDIDHSIVNKHVLIVEDIVDTGQTLAYLKNSFEMRRAASVKVVTLLDKPDRRTIYVDHDYNGFTIPDEFVIGYGLDYAGMYRTLPYIASLKRSVYEGD